MSEFGHPMDRSGDRSKMAAAANSAVLALASRGALLIVMSLVAWIAVRSYEKLESMANSLSILSTEIKVIASQTSDQARRIDIIERHVFTPRQ